MSGKTKKSYRFVITALLLPAKPVTIFTFSSSFMFDFELTRILGSASSGGCDVGEFKTAVGKIRKNDPESWFAAWNEEGERAEKIGDEAAKAGFRVLARNAYLRASNYFRVTSYMFNNSDPRVVPYTEKSIVVFRQAAMLMDGEVLFVEMLLVKKHLIISPRLPN